MFVVFKTIKRKSRKAAVIREFFSLYLFHYIECVLSYFIDLSIYTFSANDVIIKSLPMNVLSQLIPPIA